MNDSTTTIIEMSPQLNEIFAALSAAQSSIKAAKKTGKNPHLRNDYAKLEDVWQVVRPALGKHGLSVIHLTTTRDNEAGIIQILGHTSGQYIKSETMLPLSQGRGINPAQACGICFSYARRYAISGALGVCTGEDTDGAVQTRDDGDGGTVPVKSRRKKAPMSKEDKAFADRVRAIQDSGVDAATIVDVLKQGGYSRVSEVPPHERDAFLGLISPKPANAASLL